jgi:hypothetical protein
MNTLRVPQDTDLTIQQLVWENRLRGVANGKHHTDAFITYRIVSSRATLRIMASLDYPYRRVQSKGITFIEFDAQPF